MHLPLLCVFALLLPPINLLARVVNVVGGYETIEDNTGGAIIDPDGTQITLLPEGMDGDFSLTLNPIPRDQFLRGEAGGSWIAAAEQFPPYLVMKSPLYEIKSRGNPPTPC